MIYFHQRLPFTEEPDYIPGTDPVFLNILKIIS
jgi:hypothetical protein